jgi:hypothetical protein
VDERRGEAAFDYSLLTPEYAPFGGIGDTVRVFLRPAGATFEPTEGPPIGPKPERAEPVTVQGQEATLYTSELKPDPGCAVGSPCTAPNVPLYHRLVVTLGGTAIHIEALAKVDSERGIDENPFNNRDALISLAEALVPAE